MKKHIYMGFGAVVLWTLALSFGCQTRGRNPDGTNADTTTGVNTGRVEGVFSAKANATGGLRRMKHGRTTWESLKDGDSLQTGDKLQVGADSTAMVRLGNSGRISLDRNTALRIVSNKELALEQGNLWVDGMGSPNAEFGVETDVGQVVLKGATAGLGYGEKQLIASVVSGDATMKNPQKEVLLIGGQAGIATADDLRIDQIQDPGELVSWSKELRAAVASAAVPGERLGPNIPSGLGTLSAKVPGTKTTLPFEVLTQDVTVRIQDQVAVTKVEQVFRNPTGRVVEGTYKFPLPKGAKLTRYDMEIKGRMMPGEIVERKRGRGIMKKVIRQFVDMMRDPALVEWESGSTFKTRIFPILAKEEKRIVLSYIETLEGSGGKYRYVLPVAPSGSKAERLPAFRVDARIASSSGPPTITTPLFNTETTYEGDSARVSFEARDFEPVVDLVIAISPKQSREASLATYGYGGSGLNRIAGGVAGRVAGRVSGFGAGQPFAPSPQARGIKTGDDNFFVMNLTPRFSSEASVGAPNGSDWIFLADTSKSRGVLDLEIESRLIATVIGALGPKDRVKVMAFDMKPRIMNPQFQPPSPELISQTRAFFDSTIPAGATNLLGALQEGSAQVESGRHSRIVILGDGAATLGENRPGELGEWAAGIFGPTGTSVTTIGVGSSLDNLAFAEIARRTGGRNESVSTGDDLLAKAVGIVAGLRSPVLQDTSISFGGLNVTDLYPQTLPNIGSGKEISVSGTYRGTGKLTATLTGYLNGTQWRRDYTFDVGPAKKTNTFVPLLFAARKMDALTLQGDERSVEETVRLSKKYAIASRYTSFIVLENEAMYREFKVEHQDDRYQWEGIGEIDYEQMEESDADAFDSVAGEKLESEPTGGAGAMEGSGYGKGIGGMGTSASTRSRRSAPASRPKKKSKSPSALMELADPLGGLGRPYEYSRPRCRPGFRYDVSAWRIPATPRNRDLETLRAQKDRVEANPLERNPRKKLIKQLLRFGMYEHAMAEVTAWREMDGSNPVVIKYEGDLLRLSGDIESALRVYSGILDIKPEDKRIMEMLASYFESKSRMNDAYPFRVSLHLLKPDDPKRTARRAISAVACKLWDEAAGLAGSLVDDSSYGKLGLKRGVRLSKDLKESVIRIANRQRPDLLFDLTSRTEASSARFRFEIQWDEDVDLDLWGSSRKHPFLGGGGTMAKLVSGRGRGDGEILYMSSPSRGVYRFQALCAEPGGCGRVHGKLHIKAPGFRRAIPFVLESGKGTDIATVRIEKHRYRCGR